MKRINTFKEEQRCDDLSRMSEQVVELRFQSLQCDFKPQHKPLSQYYMDSLILLSATDTPE